MSCTGGRQALSSTEGRQTTSHPGGADMLNPPHETLYPFCRRTVSRIRICTHVPPYGDTWSRYALSCIAVRTRMDWEPERFHQT